VASEKFESLVDHYYKVCPGRIMPLFLLYLAEQGQLEVGDRARHVQHTDDEKRYEGFTYAQFTRDDADELAKTDNAGRHMKEKWDYNGLTQLSMLLQYDRNDRPLQDVRTIMQKHDEQFEDSMQCRHALFLFAQGLLCSGRQAIHDRFLEIASMIMKKSGLFFTSENMAMARLEAVLACDAEGPAYYPFARIPYAAALMPEKDFTVEFSGPGKELYAASASLLMRFSSEGKDSCVTCEKALDTLDAGKKYGLILSNCISRAGNDRNDEPTIHYVLKKTRRLLSDNGCFIGVDDMKFFFQSTCRRQAFREIVDEGMLCRVILLPRAFNAVMVEIRAGREDKECVEIVNLFNGRLPRDIGPSPIFTNFLDTYKEKITVSDIRERNYSIGEFFKYRYGEAPDGMKAIPLRQLISRIEKSSSSLGLNEGDLEEFNEVKLSEDNERFNPFHYEISSSRSDDMFIFEPAYLLTNDTLLVCDKGDLKPRIYDPSISGTAICREGHAFTFKHGDVVPEYIINELMKPYMTGQLEDWSHSTDGRHSGEDILSLMIFCPVNRYGRPDTDRQREICSNELDEAKLPVGFELSSFETGYTYRIVEKLGSGAFGISYKATRSLSFGDEGEETVMLKECYLRLDRANDRGEDHVTRHSVGSIDMIRSGRDGAAERKRFIDEADKLMRFGNFEDCHIRTATDLFSSPLTNTLYYVSDYYDNGTLQDIMKKGPVSEDEAIKKYIIPLAKALNILHSNRCVHLDLKPDNVLIDSDGFAVLGDLGISKLYEENGEELSSGEKGSSSEFAPPEECNINIRKFFHPEMDIFALAAIFYALVSGDDPSLFSPSRAPEQFSKESMEAIKSALEKDYTKRTSSVMDFVHALPGCAGMTFVLNELERPEPDDDEFGDLIEEPDEL